MDDTTTKPTITPREVSWHSTVAAIRARRQAESQGIDPAAKEALIFATTGHPHHPPVTIGTLWAIEASEPHIPALSKGHKTGDQAILCHVLLHPEESLLALLSGDIESFAAGLLLTACKLPPEHALTIENHFWDETERLRHLTGGHAAGTPSKKFPAPLTPLPAVPPAPGADGSSHS